MGFMLRGLTVGLLQENCYIFGCESSGEGVVIDPGDNSRAILSEIEKMGLVITRIINTHAHFDHVLAVDDIRDATGAKFYLHELELPILEEVPERVELWLSSHADPVMPPDGFLVPGERIQVGENSLEVRFTPGHSPGHVVFVDHENRQVFAGDTLFQGSIGRFDLPGADGETLLSSIREQLMTLEDDYTIYPGHGPATMIGHEREHNPFVGHLASPSLR